MAMVVVLLEDGADVLLGADALRRLARFGVTSLTVVRDPRTVALVLSGWAFDPARSVDAAVHAVGSSATSARTLHPLVEMAVSAAPPEGGTE